MADKILCEKNDLVAVANVPYTYEETDEKIEQDELWQEIEVE